MRISDWSSDVCSSDLVARRGEVAGCILHSDRWSQFRSRKQQRALTRHGMVGSMGQVGSAGDNAAMASFFALLQKNVLDRQRWATRDELRLAIVTRSEEHTSELQSLMRTSYAVFCLKKKKTKK